MGTTSLKEINENGEEKNEIRVLVGYFCSLQVLGHFEEQKSPDLVDLHNACGNRENGKADNSVYRYQKNIYTGFDGQRQTARFIKERGHRGSWSFFLHGPVWTKL
jgi:hypothetical protein